MKKKKKEKQSTLLTMLLVLDSYGVSERRLNRENGLNRTTLHSIRDGNHLRRSHSYYFKVLLEKIESVRKACERRNETNSSEYLKNVMFEVMMREFDIEIKLVAQ